MSWKDKLWVIIVVSGLPLLSFWCIQADKAKGAFRFIQYGQSIALLLFYVIFTVRSALFIKTDTAK
jgi:hypothetical protein